MFKDRKDAGRRLAERLIKYKGTDALVLGIPRGGVEVAYEVAAALDLELSVVITRKLPFPDQPEAGFGAIAEDGSSFVHEDALKWVGSRMVEEVTRAQNREIRRRVGLYRGEEPLPDISGRHVILVDDGIAMGSTVNASVLLLKNREAGKITIASPVAGPGIARHLEGIADETVILEKPEDFMAVAQVYENWYDVPDEEVIEILNKWKERAEKGKSR